MNTTPTPTPSHPSPSTPAPIRALALGASALGLLAATAAIAAASVALATSDPGPIAWWIVLLSTPALVASLLSLKTAKNPAAQGHALAPLIAVGALTVAALLPDPSIVTKLLGRGGEDPQQLALGLNTLYTCLAQLAAMGLLALTAALLPIARNPKRAIPRLLIGAPLTIVGIAIAVVLIRVEVLPAAGVSPQTAKEALLLIAQLVGVMAAVLLAGAAFCVGLHHIIRAYELSLPKPA